MYSLEIMVDHCRHCCSLYVAPATQGAVRLDYTIPDLLDMGCAYDHGAALYQWIDHQWESYSYHEFRHAVEELALGLRSQQYLFSADVHAPVRVGLLLDNDINWAMVDMASLLAGYVTIPLDIAQSHSAMRWIIQDANLQGLVISSWKTLQPIHASLDQLKLLVLLEESPPPPWWNSCSQDGRITTLTNLRRAGQKIHSSEEIHALKEAIHPEDLATIVYTADTHGIAKGALLSHRSLTGNIWAAFSSMPGLVPGEPEVALSFLPLTHIFARTFLYGHLGFGHDIYFSSPQRVFRHLATVKPTIFITVPRLLEKLYERVNLAQQQASSWRRCSLGWSWWWAHHYQLGDDHWLWYRLQRWLLGHSVYRTLRRAFGGRIRYLLSGGAALKPEVMTFFNAVGVPVKQGYGLTETSAVVSYTRDRWLQSGTVGAPIPGVEMRLASDGEVLVKSPYMMQGYHHNPEATQEVIDPYGWFHTGDLGEFTEDGVLKLQGCKKGLFKLSTGKYVAPGLIEDRLERSPLVQRAVVVGPGQKFCGVLIVPEEHVSEGTRTQLQALIDQINIPLSPWSTIKRFSLVKAMATAVVSRDQLYQRYAQEIAALYCDTEIGEWRRPKKREGRPWRWRRSQILSQEDREVHVV